MATFLRQKFFSHSSLLLLCVFSIVSLPVLVYAAPPIITSVQSVPTMQRYCFLKALVGGGIVNVCCGNGILQPALGEQCDDGNKISGDGCSNQCIIEFCGDGTVQSNLGEECDDGNTANEDGCDANCQDEFCGDGIIQAGLNEVCDSQSQSCVTAQGYAGAQSCLPNCSGYEDCQTSLFCGDSICSSPPEDTFNCFSDCPNICGNGILEFGESCDDNNTISGDGCSDICIIEFCGDGTVQAGLGEQCDDGNTIPNDGCSSTCQNEVVNYCAQLIFPNSCTNVTNLTYQIERISFDDYSPFDLSISPNGKYAAWVLSLPPFTQPNTEIHLYDEISVTRITNNIVEDRYPRVSSTGHLAWEVALNDVNNTHLVYTTNGGSPQLLSDPLKRNFLSDMNECGDITWFGIPSSSTQAPAINLYEVFHYTNTGLTQLTSNGVEDSHSRMNNLGNSAWYRRDNITGLSDIYKYTGGAVQQVTFNNIKNEYPQVNNANHILWMSRPASGPTLWKLHLYDGNTTTTLAQNAFIMSYYFLNNNGQAVWVANHTNTNHNFNEIYFYNGTSTIQITNNSIRDDLPQIADNGFIVWQAFDGQDDEIFLYTGQSIIQLTNNTNHDRFPQISKDGKYIYWVHDEDTPGDSDDEVYRATISCP